MKLIAHMQKNLEVVFSVFRLWNWLLTCMCFSKQFRTQRHHHPFSAMSWETSLDGILSLLKEDVSLPKTSFQSRKFIFSWLSHKPFRKLSRIGLIMSPDIRNLYVGI